MPDQISKAQTFADLHKKDDPVIIYNAWDGGSAKAIAGSGAKAIATGDHPVGFAHGFGEDDFNNFTFEMYLPTIKEVALRAGDLPLSVDINNADGLTGEDLAERIRTILEVGAVGINYEDLLSDESGVQSIDEQSERIRVIRKTADDAGVPLFINARSDMFAVADASEHATMIDAAVERAEAYKAAGGNGFFVPGLMDIELIRELCERVDMPVNIIRLPGAPETKSLVQAGVSRISYGPVPQMQMIEWLKEQASEAFKAAK